MSSRCRKCYIEVENVIKVEKMLHQGGKRHQGRVILYQVENAIKVEKCNIKIENATSGIKCHQGRVTL